MTNSPDDSDSLDRLAEEFVARHRSGEQPSIDEYAAQHPALAEEIRELFPTVLDLERLKLRKAISSGSSPASIGPAPLTHLGDFRIVREIGRGGMGIVYEAEQQSLHRRVALKVLGTQLGTNARQRDRFRREAEAAARLHHTNIVPVYGIGEDQGLQFFAMQFIEGVPLNRLIHAWRRETSPQNSSSPANSLQTQSIVASVQKLLAESPAEAATHDSIETQLDGSGTGSRVISPLHVEVFTSSQGGGGPHVVAGPSLASASSESSQRVSPDSAQPRRPGQWRAAWTEIAATIAAAADALAHSHHWGVLHRDVKPANLILDREGVVWVTDFGLAKLDTQDQSITGSGDFIGTLRYVAPEQLKGQADPRSDIYGLGLSLFEWITLAPAFPDEPLAEIVRRGTRELPRTPRSMNRAIPADLETITLKACASDPAHRYQTAAEFADDLRRFVEDRPIRARRVTPVEQLWRWSRKNPVIAGLGTVSLLLLLSLVTVLGVSNRRIQKTLGLLDTKSQLAQYAAEEAQNERELADANLNLAIRAFEDIMDNISARGSRVSLISDEADDPVVVHAAEVNAADAALLSRLLEFFDQFAEQNQTDLTYETAAIHRRIGDIQLQLGRAAEAEAAYRESEATYAKLRTIYPAAIPLLVAHAECWNRLGVAMTQRGAGWGAFEAHAKARKMLSESAFAEEFEVQMELAETYLLIDTVFIRSGGYELVSAMFLEGRRPPPPPSSEEVAGPPVDRPRPPERVEGEAGRGDRRERGNREPGRPPLPPGLAEWNQTSRAAVDLLEQLSRSHPDHTQIKLLLARAYRNRHYLHCRERHSELACQDLQTAIDHLTALGEAAPDSPIYRFELADLLCLPVPSSSPGEADEETISRLERAIVLLEQLLNESPTIPEYQSLLGSALRRLASIQMISSKLSLAESGLRRAIEIQASLARRYPTTSLYQITYVKSLMGLSDLLAGSDRAPEAMTHIERAIAVMGDFLERHPDEFLIRPFQDRLVRRREKIREAMNQSPPPEPPAT